MAMLLVLVNGSVSRAQSPESVTINNLAEGGIILNIGSALQDLGDQILGAGSRFVNGLSTDTTSPSAGEVRTATLTATATTTLQEITRGSKFTKTFSFTAGNTTTVGALFSLQNTGVERICTDVQANFSTVAGAGTILARIGTSTATDAWSATGVGWGGLISSTTVPTSTAVLANAVDDGGSGMNSWLWGAGVFLNGVFDVGIGNAQGPQGNASSSVYSSNAGTVYVNCHTE